MTDYKDGDTITVNGKPCRIEGGALVPVVKRGPLGGELKRLGDCAMGDCVFLPCVVIGASEYPGYITCQSANGFGVDAYNKCEVETNIPPRPTFTPMTAGDAAKLPDIVGRWVAFPVGLTRDAFEPLALDAGEAEGLIWLDNDTDLFLIEGVDL